ncbi:MAG: hypothetical protein J1F36_01355 [Clostridiales bacterium]|nr:hypothetical protein [Clostridiales bacterium]
MYDFDRLFTKYIRGKGHVHEDELDEVYLEWLNKYSEDLGAAPIEVLNNMSDSELIAELKEECFTGAPSLTIMENVEKRAPVQLLIPLLYEDDVTLVYCAAEILRNLDKAPLDIFADMLIRTDDSDLFELIISALKFDPDSVRDRLLEIAENSDMRIKTVVAEILSEGSRDERVYKLLTELFASGDNLPLYSSYFVRYGDERAVGILYRALDSAAYADYIEIRNAIEALGGIVDENKDFSSDPDYIYIKESGSGK